MYRLSRVIIRLAFRLLGGITATGVENFPLTGGVILAPNHISYLDPPAVGCPISRQVHYMAKEELFKVPVLGSWMRWVGAFPVRRGTADRTALKRAIELLEQGRVVCIFPEGTRSPDGNLQEAELGIGLIALKSRAPVVPAAITGTDKALPPGSFRLKRHHIRIAYGKPLYFHDLYDAPSTRQTLTEVGQRVMSAIAQLQTNNVQTLEHDSRQA